MSTLSSGGSVSLALGEGGGEVPPASFMVRLAIRVSRSRGYSFLRRVFHYQNGSGASDLGPNPFDSNWWMLMEMIGLTIEITAVGCTLMLSYDEAPVWPMRIWVLGYASACFLSLVLLCWRFRLLHLLPDDIEHQAESGRYSMMYLQKMKSRVELVFAIWFVMGNVWMFDSRLGSYDGAPKLHFLCVSLLAWNAITYSFPFILFLLLCCCVPLVSKLIGYNMNTHAFLCRGATDKQLAALRRWSYDTCRDSTQQQIQDCCCICLAMYRYKDEIRQLPCCHIFHLNCVDQWLKIIPCCPLCKQGIDKLNR